MPAPGSKLGLKLEQELGVNPFKFGMIGSTDSHTSLATADEDNFFGKHSGAEPSPARATHVFLQSPDGKREDHGLGEGRLGLCRGLGTENTRAAIFDALERKEVYATTGPRMIVRFFGGFDFQPGDAHDPQSRRGRLCQGRADGRRSHRGPGGQGARASWSPR